MANLNKQNAPVMNPTEVVKAYLAAFAQKDWGKAIALLHEEVIWHVDGDANVPTVGLLRGPVQVRKWLERFPSHFEPLDFTLAEFIEQDENVLVLGRFRHLITETGNRVGSDMVIHFKVSQSKISRYQIFEDSALLSRAFNSQDTWQQHQIKINGTLYHYREQGEGPTLFFAHGLFVDGEIFNDQINVLSQSFRCIVMDMPGHGQSGFNPDGWTLDDISRDFALMIQELSLREVTFIGQSQGGMVGLRLAASFPDLLSGLILIGTSARAEYPEREDSWQRRRDIMLNGSRPELDTMFTAIQREIYGEEGLRRHASFITHERNLMMTLPRSGLALAMDAAVFNRDDIRALLPSIRIPALVICGDADRATPVGLSREIADVIPDTKLIVLTGAGHHPVVDAAQQVTRAIGDFLLSRAKLPPR
ncbi:alpha/beta fold hydrolase [Erwinia sp. P6884]|uniref:alpha/beta fold hydrolase n=1 Tax=Erwinia sp. P6884 TaxID=3141450 RepID=UPI003189E9E0